MCGESVGARLVSVCALRAPASELGSQKRCMWCVRARVRVRVQALGARRVLVFVTTRTASRAHLLPIEKVCVLLLLSLSLFRLLILLNPSTTTMNRRRALLDAADEDDLLRLQAEFQAAREVPCAAVTSVARTRDAPTVAAPPSSPPPCPGNGADHAQKHAESGSCDGGGVTPPLPPLLGAVRERDVSVRAGGAPSLSARPPPRPPAPGAGAAAAPAAASTAAFPQATHRRVSKVRVHACVRRCRETKKQRESVCVRRRRPWRTCRL